MFKIETNDKLYHALIRVDYSKSHNIIQVSGKTYTVTVDDARTKLRVHSVRGKTVYQQSL